MPRRAHKYGAKPCEIDGHKFASQKEGARYRELRLLEKAWEIRCLRLQPDFDLHAAVRINGLGLVRMQKIGRYVADFTYQRRSIVVPGEWVQEYEDVKGFKTPLYKWKKKHVEAQYGITIREI